MTYNKLNLDITPLRLTVVLGGLLLLGLNEFLEWNIPFLTYVFIIAVVLSVFLTQPHTKK